MQIQSNSTSPFTAHQLGQTTADFSAIRAPYAPQAEMQAMLMEGLETCLALRAKRTAMGVKLPMPALRSMSEMGTGKTVAAELFEREINANAPEARRPVLLTTLDTSGSQASVPQAILRGLGAKRWDLGKPATLWNRALDEMRRFDVQMIIFDEFNRAARRPSIGPVIGGDIMDLMVTGEAAVVFLCTHDADPLFNRAPALKDRLRAPVIIKALDWQVAGEQRTFIKFLADMDQAMVDIGLIRLPAGLDHEGIAHHCWSVSRGRLRPLCLMLEEALTGAQRRGAEAITIDDLANAVETISIPSEHISYNPFSGETPE